MWNLIRKVQVQTQLHTNMIPKICLSELDSCVNKRAPIWNQEEVRSNSLVSFVFWMAPWSIWFLKICNKIHLLEISRPALRMRIRLYGNNRCFQHKYFYFLRTCKIRNQNFIYSSGQEKISVSCLLELTFLLEQESPRELIHCEWMGLLRRVD